MADDNTLNYETPQEVSAGAAPPKGALGIIFLIVFVDLLGFGLIIPLLPFYARSLHASDLQVTLLFSVYSICQFIAAPFLGLISDRHGRRGVLVFSQIGSVIGFVLLGYATGRQWESVQLGLMLVYLSRLIDGLSGGNISTAQAYISDVTSHENRAKGMGLLGAAFGIGFIGGPALAGALYALTGKASIPAYAAAVFSGTAAILTYTKLPESRVHRPAEAEAWLHPKQFLSVMRRPVVLQLTLIWFVAMAAFVMIDSTIALYLNDIFHFTGDTVAWYFVFVGLIIAAVQGGLIGRLTKKLGEWSLSTIGPILVAIGYAITLTTIWHPLKWILLVGGAIYAFGRSIQQPTISALVSQNADPRQHGTTFGLFQGMGTWARVIGPIIAGVVYSHHPIGPFVTAGILVFIAGAWTGILSRLAGRLQPAQPEQGRGLG
jgi:DHA1 family tetracycline resistance protein-like MFS transporter